MGRLNWSMVKEGAKGALKAALLTNPVMLPIVIVGVTVVEGYNSGMNMCMGVVGIGYETILKVAKARVDTISEKEAREWYNDMFSTKNQCLAFMNEIPVQTERRKLRFCQHCAYNCQLTHGDMEMFKAILKYELNRIPETPVGYVWEATAEIPPIPPIDLPDWPGWPKFPGWPKLPGWPDMPSFGAAKIIGLFVILIVLLIALGYSGMGGIIQSEHKRKRG